MPNPVISTCTSTKNIAKKSTKSTLFTQKRGRGRHGPTRHLSIQKNKKKPGPWSFEPPPHRCWCRLYHLIAGNTAMAKGKIHVGQKYDEIVKSFLEYVEKSLSHWDPLRYI